MKDKKHIKGFNEAIEKLNISEVIESETFRNDLEKAFELSYDVSFSEEGGSDFFNEQTAIEETLKVIKKHFLKN